MIAVDTSALMAILLNEPDAAACAVALDRADDLVISAATVTEGLIVAGRRGLAGQMSALLTRLAFTVVPVFEADARRAADAHALWGKALPRRISPRRSYDHRQNPLRRLRPPRRLEFPSRFV